VLRLVTLPISHYCEKARWGLDRAGVEYREERHVQGIHRIYSRRAGGHGTLPVLVTPEGSLAESEEILIWADQRTAPEGRLFPAGGEERERALALCRRYDRELGPRGRRLIYVHMLPQRDLVIRFNDLGVPGWEDGLLRHTWPVMTRFVARALDIRPGVEAEDEPAVWREFDFTAELLAEGGPYLSGARFGAADLTFAALAAPVISPPEYGIPLPQPDLMSAETADLVTRFREHPAGRHALRMFAEHRAERVAAQVPT
jgi:glutathione S-transferase